MARFLVATTPIDAHTANPLPIVRRLVERGHEVRWYAGSHFHERVRAVGAVPVGYTRAWDFSEPDGTGGYRRLRELDGPRAVSAAMADVFLGQAPARVADLRAELHAHPAEVMLADLLAHGVGMLHELGGPPWASMGDGPLPWDGPGVPPFGPGWLPRSGAWGRTRDRHARFVRDRLLLAGLHARWRSIRAELGLPPPSGSVLTAALSPLLHLQGCPPGFEYPRVDLPPSVHWVGPFRPEPPAWVAPSWWPEVATARAAGRPVVLVSQGTMRTDPSELIVPTLHALGGSAALVVVLAGGCDLDVIRARLGGDLPAAGRVTAFIPYDVALSCSDVFVTNGGYTGVALALAHGVPMVQAGTSEEKREVGARIEWSGVGLRLRSSRPRPTALGRAVEAVLTRPQFREAARRLAAECRDHDAVARSVDLLEELAARHPSRRAAPGSRPARSSLL